MTPTKAGILGAAIGAVCTAAVAAGGFVVYDKLTYAPTTQEGTCDQASYYFNLTVLGRAVLGEIVIEEPANLEIRNPNPNWLVKWDHFDAEVEHVKTEGIGTPMASSSATLSDTDEGGTRTVRIKRTDGDQWCTLTSSLG